MTEYLLVISVIVIAVAAVTQLPLKAAVVAGSADAVKNMEKSSMDGGIGVPEKR